MKKNGTILLIDKKDNPVDVKQYQNPTDRKNIINKWKDIYFRTIGGSYLLIQPNA